MPALFALAVVAIVAAIDIVLIVGHGLGTARGRAGAKRGAAAGGQRVGRGAGDRAGRIASDAAAAYALGLHEVLPVQAIVFQPPAQWPLAFDRAMPRLDLIAPVSKELVVLALARAISADGILSVAESELLRTVCAALHCPLPPLLAKSCETLPR